MLHSEPHQRLIAWPGPCSSRILRRRPRDGTASTGDGTIEDEAALHLDPSALADRREIVAIVEHLRDEGESTGAVGA